MSHRLALEPRPTLARAGCCVAVHVVLQVVFVGRALLRPHREPASRLAWVVVIIVAPVVGMLAYVLFGETNIGRRRIARLRAGAWRGCRAFAEIGRHEGERRGRTIPPRYAPLFRVGQSISGFPAVGGNRGELLGDSDDVIDAHGRRHRRRRATTSTCCFYIWLPDSNGLKVVEALKRAAARGVTCRAMADDLGSRADDPLASTGRRWRTAGVRLARALPIGNPLSRPLKGRIDMRNHRKIVVIDNRITYCGSQNCADAAFAHQGEVRALGRRDDALRGADRAAEPARSSPATGWAHVNEDLEPLLREPLGEVGAGFPAQVIGTGADGALLGDAGDVRER